VVIDDAGTGEALAAARFEALPAFAQMSLARDTAASRSAELILAHRGLSMVTAGYRARRDAQGQALFHPQPCVILGVERKWSGQPDVGESDARRLPRFLLAHGSFGGRRQLYAVPTDVQPVAWFHGALARSASAVWADTPQDHGALTCAVQVQTPAGPRSFALSALHVLSPWARMNLAMPDGGQALHPAGAPGPVGASTSWGGGLRRAGISFDAQLASIGNTGWFNAAFAQDGLPAAGAHVRSANELDRLIATQSFMLLAPSNHPKYPGGRSLMIAQFRSYAGSSVPIDYKVRYNGVRTRMRIWHRELVQLEVTSGSPAPAEGDSGCAVITWRLDNTPVLAGMFIASLDAPSERVAYMLPAWQLFDPSNWAALPPGATRLTPRFRLP
jgi:hypothetical protein